MRGKPAFELRRGHHPAGRLVLGCCKVRSPTFSCTCQPGYLATLMGNHCLGAPPLAGNMSARDTARNWALGLSAHKGSCGLSQSYAAEATDRTVVSGGAQALQSRVQGEWGVAKQNQVRLEYQNVVFTEQSPSPSESQEVTSSCAWKRPGELGSFPLVRKDAQDHYSASPRLIRRIAKPG